VIVDDLDEVIYKDKDVPIKKGIVNVLSIIEKKDSRKTVKGILHKFSKYLDDEFKTILGMGDEDEKN